MLQRGLIKLLVFGWQSPMRLNANGNIFVHAHWYDSHADAHV